MKFIIIDVILCSQAKKLYDYSHTQTNKNTVAANSRRVSNQSHS